MEKTGDIKCDADVVPEKKACCRSGCCKFKQGLNKTTEDLNTSEQEQLQKFAENNRVPSNE